MTSRGLRAAAVLAALVGLLLSACGSEVQGTATPAGRVGPRRCHHVQRHRRHEDRRGQDTATDVGGDVDFEVEIGDCVKLGGTIDDAEIDHAECGSARVELQGDRQGRQQQPSASATPTRTTTRHSTAYEQGALCLDVDWVVGGCMDLSAAEDPRRIDCADPRHATACG